MIAEISIDDGDVLDLRSADLLRDIGLDATFYIPTNCELSDEEVKSISGDFEVGGHTTSHPVDMKLLSDELLHSEIDDNRKWLADVTGKPPTKFCYPRGRYDDRVMRVVRHCGYHQARTTLVGYTREPLDAFRRHTTVHCFQRPEYGSTPWLQYAIIKLSEATSINGYFHLWFHSWEIEENDDWRNLETILRILRENLP